MITKLYTVEELKEIFVETLFNKTDKVTKISETSVLNGIAYGTAKIGQKVLKDIALIESHIFPDSAYGEYLDNIAILRGVSPRRASTESSMYIRIFANPGTKYFANTHTFTGSHGVIFKLENDVTVSDIGYTYVKVRSKTKGENTNVDALSTNKVTPIPQGHNYCINEYQAIGGSNYEDDDLFRKRIKQEINLHARSTLSYLEQVFFKINSNVLRCFHYGFNNQIQVIIGIATVNGIDLTENELNDLLVKSEKYLSLIETKQYGYGYVGLKLQNVSWFPIDISFRCDLDESFNVDILRKNIQVNVNKLFDYRFWDWTNTVEWDNILDVVKHTEGVRYVADNYFFPNVDIVIPRDKLPRVRGFQMLNLEGEVILDFQGNLNPVYYPSDIDFIYQANYLQNI